MEREHRRVLLLAAEAAAGLRLDDPTRGRRAPGRAASAPCGRSTGTASSRGRRSRRRRGHGDHRVVLDVQLLLVADAVLALDDEVGAGEAASTSPRATSYWAKTELGLEGSKTGRSASVRSVTRRLPRGASRGPARRAAPPARPGGGSRPRPGRGSAGRPDRADDVLARDVVRGHDDDRDQSNAGSSSIAEQRGVRSVERIVAPYQAPGKTRSSVYSAVPVSLAGPSRRAGRRRRGWAAGGAAGVDPRRRLDRQPWGASVEVRARMRSGARRCQGYVDAPCRGVGCRLTRRPRRRARPGSRPCAGHRR